MMFRPWTVLPGITRLLRALRGWLLETGNFGGANNYAGFLAIVLHVGRKSRHQKVAETC